MVRVLLSGSLRHISGGKAEIDIEARNFRELLDRLAAEYPAMQAEIDQGVSMALDGVIYRDAWFTEIGPDSEVVLMPLMKGG